MRGPFTEEPPPMRLVAFRVLQTPQHPCRRTLKAEAYHTWVHRRRKTRRLLASNSRQICKSCTNGLRFDITGLEAGCSEALGVELHRGPTRQFAQPAKFGSRSMIQSYPDYYYVPCRHPRCVSHCSLSTCLFIPGVALHYSNTKS